MTLPYYVPPEQLMKDRAEFAQKGIAKGRSIIAVEYADGVLMLAENARRAPLRRNVTTAEVGNAAAFLSSDLASGITGEIMYVDAGFNITGMGELED